MPHKWRETAKDTPIIESYNIENDARHIASEEPSRVINVGGVAVRRPEDCEDEEDEEELSLPTSAVALTKSGPHPTLMVSAAGMYVWARGLPLIKAASKKTAMVACVHLLQVGRLPPGKALPSGMK